MAKTEFLSNMSHDMRTPMNGILGLANLMKDKDNLAEIRQDINQILISGQYLLNLINDTLDMNKIEIGNLELHLKPINSEDVLKNLMVTSKLMAADNGIEMNINLPDIKHGEWRTVFADASRLEQIFMNIISNAIKYTPRGGKIDIIMETLSISESFVKDRYIIRDNGIGMSEEFLPHLFDAFSQEGRINTERQNGTGLGMSIVKKLLELMDGEISVKSEEGKGTEVTLVITYPVSRDKVKAKQRDKKDISILQNKKILLCEDHPLNSMIARQMLEKKGISVVTAENGKLALDTFAGSAVGEFDAILMDIRMPIMNGIDATKAIRSLDRVDAVTIPIAALTANAFDGDVQTCMDAGMNAHLFKPFDVEKLYQTLAELISERRS